MCSVGGWRLAVDGLWFMEDHRPSTIDHRPDSSCINSVHIFCGITFATDSFIELYKTAFLLNPYNPVLRVTANPAFAGISGHPSSVIRHPSFVIC